MKKNKLSQNDLIIFENKILNKAFEILMSKNVKLLKELNEELNNLHEEDIIKLDKVIKQINKLNLDNICKNNIRSKKIKDTLKTYGLDNYIIPNNKLSNVLTAKDVFNKQIFLETLAGNAKDVTTSCFISYDEENIIFQSYKPFTEYDRAVYNAIVSHYIAGNIIITPDMICRAMTGKTNTSVHPSPQQVEAVITSMKKMRFIEVNLDLTNEFIKRDILLDDEYITSYSVNTILLDFKNVSVSTKSRTINAFIIKEPPILYAYSQSIDQIITIPLEILNTPTDNTENTINLKNYLIRRIEGIRGDNKLKQDIVLLSNIYELLEIELRQEKNRVRTQITKILNYWIQQDYITSYEFIKKGRTFYSIKLDI